MKVKELRNWLAEVSDKHKHRNMQKTAARKKNKPSSVANPTEPTSPHDGSLKCNVSTDWTDTTRDDSSMSEAPQAATSFDSSLVSPDASFDDSNTEFLVEADPTAVTCTPIDVVDGAPAPTAGNSFLPPNMCNADILTNQTLTAQTLDLVCNTERQTTTTTTLSAHLEQREETETLHTASSVNSEFSVDSHQPSICIDALDSKMARLLLEQPDSPKEADSSLSRVVPPPPRRKLVEPKDLTFLQPKTTWSEATLDAPRPPSAVLAGIRKFGGPQKKIVERRKEELERIWAESRSVQHVKKVKWGACKQSGTYKKKIVIDVVYNKGEA